MQRSQCSCGLHKLSGLYLKLDIIFLNSHLGSKPAAEEQQPLAACGRIEAAQTVARTLDRQISNQRKAFDAAQHCATLPMCGVSCQASHHLVNRNRHAVQRRHVLAFPHQDGL